MGNSYTKSEAEVIAVKIEEYRQVILVIIHKTMIKSRNYFLSSEPRTYLDTHQTLLF